MLVRKLLMKFEKSIYIVLGFVIEDLFFVWLNWFFIGNCLLFCLDDLL